MSGAVPRICIARFMLYASTCKLISVLTRGTVLVEKCVAISYSCPILQQLMSKIMSRRAANQRIRGLARKILKMESWIWTSIADS